MLVICSSQNIKRGHKLELIYLYACWIKHLRYHFANIKMVCQRWPEMPFILGRSGTQYVVMVTKLLSSCFGAHVAESYCKESNISDTNWLRYLFSSYLIKIWLNVWRHHWANLHILKTWISLERKEIFQYSKQHFSSHRDYLFMF